MTVLDYTVTTLVSRVRRTCQIATDNTKLSTDEIVQICDEEIQQNLFPRLVAVSEDYQETETTMLLTSGVKAYRLPYTAASETVHRVNLTQLSGSTVVGSIELSRVPASRIASYVSSAQGSPVAYAIRGDQIVVLPTPSAAAAAGYVLSISHPVRPSRLTVTTADYAAISLAAVNGALVDLTCIGTIPANFVNGAAIDIVAGQPPLAPIALGGLIVAIAGWPILSVSAGYSVTAADAVALCASTQYPIVVAQGFTPVFPLPDAWWSAAILACSASVLRATGDNAGSDACRVDSEAAIARLVSLQTNRVRDQPLAVFNRSSPLRRSRRSWIGSNS